MSGLKPEMAARNGVGGPDLEMRNDDADQGRYAREVREEVEDVDDQGELLARQRGLGGWIRPES